MAHHARRAMLGQASATVEALPSHGARGDELGLCVWRGEVGDSHPRGGLALALPRRLSHFLRCGLSRHGVDLLKTDAPHLSPGAGSSTVLVSRLPINLGRGRSEGPGEPVPWG